MHKANAASMISTIAAGLVLAACTDQTPAAPTGAEPASAESAQTAVSGDPAVYRGAAIAKQVCAQCHDIGDGSKPAIFSQAPTFKAVAEKPETTAEGLSQWLRSSHPSMPHYVFPENETADLVAYVMSLRPAQ